MSKKNYRAPFDGKQAQEICSRIYIFLNSGLYTVISRARFCSVTERWVPHVRIVAAKAGAHRIEGVQHVSRSFRSRKKAVQHGLYIGYVHVMEKYFGLPAGEIVP
jgi:hypothetical protein